MIRYYVEALNLTPLPKFMIFNLDEFNGHDIIHFARTHEASGRASSIRQVISCPDDSLLCRDVKFNVSTRISDL